MTSTEFWLYFPEFKKVDGVIVDRHLRQSENECPPSIWGRDRDQVIGLLTAHKLSMWLFQQGAMAGAAVEAAKGGSPSLPTGDSTNLMATTYGQEFQRLKNTLGTTGFVV